MTSTSQTTTTTESTDPLQTSNSVQSLHSVKEYRQEMESVRKQCDSEINRLSELVVQKESKCPFAAKSFSINKRPMDDSSDDEPDDVKQQTLESASSTNSENKAAPSSLSSSASASSEEILFLPNEEPEAKRKHSDSSNEADGPPHIAYNVLTEYQEKQLYGKYYLIRRDIIAALDDEHHDDGSWGMSPPQSDVMRKLAD